MKLSINYSVLTLVAILLFGCQEEVTLPLGEKDAPVPIVEGYWTDQGPYNEVKFGFSQDYYDTTGFVPITDASIEIVSLSTGQSFPFIYVNGTKSYKPVNPNRTGKIGESYALKINWKDQEYIAQGELLAPPILDSLTWKFEEERPFRDAGYYVKVYGKIPFVENNNYRIRVIENDTLKNQREDYLLFDDTFGLRFFEQGLELGYGFKENDRVRLELFRLNQDAFDYLNQLVNLLFNDGGLFSPPPQNPTSNIQVSKGGGEVLGYFAVTPVLVRTLVIQEKYD
ncbi:DUF4249 family protein [Algoriphagus sanaruensis]|uniref:DUF4249 domain-containing protein n=1 Tax=Algoriphagus sanaruensis TaxID=1727163 RepID=A0A142ENU6_9BACT|nr:DUF4249 family protein [Algoriphagus sanaruensis]AMQ56801.1 hypothetical protein AO498_10210 [Algoriphagus sanaruensis]